MATYKVRLENKDTLVKRDVYVNTGVLMEDLTARKIVGLLGRNEVRGERIVNWVRTRSEDQ
jgi:hypothetical protein